MESNNINISRDANRALEALQAKNGTYNYYNRTLMRLSRLVLHHGDEIGMSDTEALSTLRAVDALRADLSDIAGPIALIPDVDVDLTEEDLQKIADLYAEEDEDEQPDETTDPEA